MSLSRQSGSIANGGATTIVGTWAAATQAGDCGVASIWVNGGTAIDVTPPSGWQLATAEVDKSTSVMLATYVYPNMPVRAAGATETFTIVQSGTSTPNSNEAGLVWAAYPGIASVSVIDKQNQATGATATADSGATGTLSSGNEILVASVAHKSAPATFDLDTASATGGFTLVAKVGSSGPGTLKINGALFEKDAAGSTASGDLTVPILGGAQSWCGKIISLNKAGGAPPATGTDDGKVYRCSEGHYYSFTLPDLATAQAWALKNQLITSQPNKLGGFADQMVVSNPALVLAPYDKTVQLNPGSYGITNLPESWFAHSASPGTTSNRIAPPGFASVFIMQPDSTSPWTDTGAKIGPAGAVYNGWRPFVAQLIKNDVQVANDAYASSDPFTGWFGDSAGSFSLQNQVVPGTNTQYTLSAWLILVNLTLDAINAALPGKSGWANGIDSNPDMPNHVSAGTMNENWLWPSSGAATSWPSDAAFTAACQVALDSQVISLKTMRGITHAWALTAATDIEHRRRGLIAAYFLSNRGKLLIEYSVTKSTAPWLVDQGPAFTVDLHSPRDTQAQITSYRVKQGGGSGWLYQRRYNRGCVLFNTDANPIVWTLDRSDYKELDGTAAPQTYTIPGKSGVILTATSDPIAAPANTVAPGVPTGTQTQGFTLTAVNGTWTGSPSFSYQWQRDNAGGGVFTDIPGATSPTYGLMGGDVGNKIRVKVTGTNAGGSATANSTATGLIAAGAAAPSNTALPVLTPTQPSAGQTVTTTNGTWTGTPSSFSYQWQHVDPNTLVATNVGLNQNSYDVQDSDAGFLIRCTVTATNGSGSTPINSAPTDVVAPRPPSFPVNTIQPAIPSGSTTQGGTLTADNGTWTGSPTSFTYQWQQFDGTTATDIPGATNSTYVTQTNDIGAEIQVVVTASNIGGSSSPATSLPTAAIAAIVVPPPPPPVVVGAATWRFVLCSRDGTPLKVLEQTTGRRLTQQFMAPSILTLTCPINAITDGVLDEGYTRLKAYRENTLVFHGRVWDTIDVLDDTQGERCTITAYDPLFTFGLTPLSPTLSLAEAILDQQGLFQWGKLPMFTLLEQIMAYFSTGYSSDSGYVSGYHPGEMAIGLKVGASPRVGRSSRSSDLMYTWCRERLIDIDNGMEWVCRPIEGTVAQYDVNQLFGGSPMVQSVEQIAALDLYYPYAGSAQPVTLSYGTATGNLQRVEQSSPGSEIVNWAVASGGGNGKHPLARQAHDATSINRRGVLLKTDSFGNTGDTEVLSQRAKHLLQPTPLRALKIIPRPGAVRLFDDFQVGDTVNVAIKAGRVQRYGHQRVYGATLELSDTDGAEVLSELVIGDPPTGNKAAKIPRTPAEFNIDAIAAHGRRLRQLESDTPVTDSFVDESTGIERYRNGLQDDGTWGVRVWSDTGVLVFDHTA